MKKTLYLLLLFISANAFGQVLIKKSDGTDATLGTVAKANSVEFDPTQVAGLTAAATTTEKAMSEMKALLDLNDVTGDYIGSATTFATLPTTNPTKTAENGDWALLNDGNSQIYVYDGTDYQPGPSLGSSAGTLTEAQITSLTGADYTTFGMVSAERMDQHFVSRLNPTLLKGTVALDLTALNLPDNMTIVVHNESSTQIRNITWNQATHTGEIAFVSNKQPVVSSNGLYALPSSAMALIEFQGNKVEIIVSEQPVVKTYTNMADAVITTGHQFNTIIHVGEGGGTWIRKTGSLESFLGIENTHWTRVDKDEKGIDPWQATTAYVAGDEITANRNSDGTLYIFSRIADGNSGANFDATEEALWTPMGEAPINAPILDFVTISFSGFFSSYTIASNLVLIDKAGNDYSMADWAVIEDSEGLITAGTAAFGAQFNPPVNGNRTIKLKYTGGAQRRGLSAVRVSLRGDAGSTGLTSVISNYFSGTTQSQTYAGALQGLQTYDVNGADDWDFLTHTEINSDVSAAEVAPTMMVGNAWRWDRRDGVPDHLLPRNGQTINNADVDYPELWSVRSLATIIVAFDDVAKTITLDDFNITQRFERGGTVAGIEQEDATAVNGLSVNDVLNQHWRVGVTGGGTPAWFADGYNTPQSYTMSSTDPETRPINKSYVSCIIAKPWVVTGSVTVNQTNVTNNNSMTMGVSSGAVNGGVDFGIDDFLFRFPTGGNRSLQVRRKTGTGNATVNNRMMTFQSGGGRVGTDFSVTEAFQYWDTSWNLTVAGHYQQVEFTHGGFHYDILWIVNNSYANCPWRIKKTPFAPNP